MKASPSRNLKVTRQFPLAQNFNNFALLNLKIKDSSTGKIIFEKSAGYYEVISVNN